MTSLFIPAETPAPSMIDEPATADLYLGALDVFEQQDIPSNLVETWACYYLQVALPGADPASLDVETVARHVMVRGRRDIPDMEVASNIWREIPEGTFSHVFDVPGEVDGDKAKAQYERGILTIELPKVAFLRPSSIPVEVVL